MEIHGPFEYRDGKLRKKPWKLFGWGMQSALSPHEIILSEEEAIEWGLDPNYKKGRGYYTKIDGYYVSIIIEKNKTEEN